MSVYITVYNTIQKDVLKDICAENLTDCSVVSSGRKFIRYKLTALNSKYPKTAYFKYLKWMKTDWPKIKKKGGLWKN